MDSSITMKTEGQVKQFAEVNKLLRAISKISLLLWPPLRPNVHTIHPICPK